MFSCNLLTLAVAVLCNARINSLSLSGVSTAFSHKSALASSKAFSPYESVGANGNLGRTESTFSRSSFLRTLTASMIGFSTLPFTPRPSNAIYDNDPLKDNLYFIIRVKEATLQESRLISGGRYKDVQRANVKLAIRFMINNYQLSDRIIASSNFISDFGKRQRATETGMSVVENLTTIMEYFDAGGVENLKVGASGMGGKEPLVKKGLESAGKKIDDFLTYFPESEVSAVKEFIAEENALNEKEFDTKLGAIINPSPKV